LNYGDTENNAIIGCFLFQRKGAKSRKKQSKFMSNGLLELLEIGRPKLTLLCESLRTFAPLR
jgi:hypothetical protein